MEEKLKASMLEIMLQNAENEALITQLLNDIEKAHGPDSVVLKEINYKVKANDKKLVKG